MKRLLFYTVVTIFLFLKPIRANNMFNTISQNGQLVDVICLTNGSLIECLYHCSTPAEYDVYVHKDSKAEQFAQSISNLILSFRPLTEYFKRGMYDCALEYLKDIQEIHRYVQKASARQQQCKSRASSTDKTFPKTNIAPFDEYIERMRQEEEESTLENGLRATTTL